MRHAAACRGTMLLGLWAVVAGVHPADLPAGLAAVGLATWASLALLPPSRRAGPRLPALAALLLRLPGQVLVAGATVARRALDPRATVRPGVVAQATRLPPGLMRDSFLALASLMPGTLPAGEDAQGRVLIHALDLDQPVAADMAREEARFARALGADA